MVRSCPELDVLFLERFTRDGDDEVLHPIDVLDTLGEGNLVLASVPGVPTEGVQTMHLLKKMDCFSVRP